MYSCHNFVLARAAGSRNRGVLCYIWIRRCSCWMAVPSLSVVQMRTFQCCRQFSSDWQHTLWTWGLSFPLPWQVPPVMAWAIRETKALGLWRALPARSPALQMHLARSFPCNKTTPWLQRQVKPTLVLPFRNQLFTKEVLLEKMCWSERFIEPRKATMKKGECDP